MDLKTILEGLKALFKFLLKIWRELPPETKERIMNSVEAFWKPIFEKYYDSKRKGSHG